MRMGSLSVVIFLFLILLFSSGCMTSPQQGTASTQDSGTESKAAAAYPTSIGGLSITCSGNQPAFITKKNIYQTPQMAEPAARTVMELCTAATSS